MPTLTQFQRAILAAVARFQRGEVETIGDDGHTEHITFKAGQGSNGWAPMLLIQAEVHDPHHTGKVPHELAELHRRGFVDEREGAIMYPPDLGYVGFRRADGLFVHIDQSDDGEKIACRLGDDTRLFLSHGGNRKGLLYRVTPAGFNALDTDEQPNRSGRNGPTRTRDCAEKFRVSENTWRNWAKGRACPADLHIRKAGTRGRWYYHEAQ